MDSNSNTPKTSSNCFTKITRVLLLVCTMFSADIGVWAQENTRVSNPDRPIVIAITDRIASFDPYSIEYWQFPDFRFLLYEALIYFDQSQNPIPELAESWEVSDDGKTWTIHLKPDVRFSNGELLTADVVKSLFIRAMESDIWRQILRFPAIVDNVEVITENEISFDISTHNPAFEFIQVFSVEIVDPTSENEKTENRPRGTGPYQLDSVIENEYRFKANPYYHLGQSDIDEIILRYYPNHAAAWAAFLRGEVDAIDDISHDNFVSIAKNPKFTVYEYIDPFYYTLTMNNEHPLLSDIAMRKAISLAIDGNDIIQTALRGAAFQAAGPYLPSIDNHQDNLSQRFNLIESQQILDSLGWYDADGNGFRERNGDRLEFSLLIDSADNIKARVASRLKWQLFRVGIQLNIEEVGLDSYIQKRLIPGMYDLTVLQYTVGINRLTQLNLFWNDSFIGRTNIARFSSPRFNEIIDEILNNPSQLFDTSRLREAAMIPVNEYASSFLFYKKRYSALTSDVVIRQPISAGLFFKSAGTWSLAGEEPNQ